MFTTVGSRAGRGRAAQVYPPTTAWYEGDNGGDISLSSGVMTNLGNYTASIPAVPGQLVEMEVSGTVLAANVVGSTTYVEFAFFVNGNDIARYAEPGMPPNSTGTQAFTIMHRARRVVTPADLNGGMFTVQVKYIILSGATSPKWLNSSGLRGLLTVTNLG